MAKNNVQDTIEVVGALHVHSLHSDGTRTIDEIASIADQVGLDYIVVNDHMTLAGRPKAGWGDSGNTLLVVGYEHNDRDNKNHYLALGSSRVFDELDTAKEYVRVLREDGAVGFIAHPCEKRKTFSNLPSYPWTAEDVTEYDGIEVWNQMSDWVENLTLLGALVRLVHPRRLLTGPPTEALRLWDRRNKTGFISGIGGVDAHSHRFGFGPVSLEIFPLKVELKGVRTHLFVPAQFKKMTTEDATVALLAALKQGNGFISNLRWGDARGSRFRYHFSGSGGCGPGALPVPVEPGGRLEVSIPRDGVITVVRNGEITTRVSGTNLEFCLEQPGVYRVEVHRKCKPWIFSNPFPIGLYPF